MKPNMKRILYLVIVLLPLMILNPSFVQFKEFLGDNTNIATFNTGSVIAYIPIIPMIA